LPTQSNGTCAICQETVARGMMLDHLRSCLDKADGDGPQPLIQLRVEGAEAKTFWLDLDVKADSKLVALDRFLRGIWLECCGHLSAFTIGLFRYESMPDHEYGPRPDLRTMGHRIDRALGRLQTPFGYEYDFGSTTELRIMVTARRAAPPRRNVVRLLARNTEPQWPCSHPRCSHPATSICAVCVYEGSAFACDRHATRHTCGEPDSWHPVVNSPRMGVCGYMGAMS
jgi:hypothetical protein